MAKKKKRRRTSLLTKAINVGVLGLAFSRVISLFLENASDAPRRIVIEATGNLVHPGATGGNFQLDTALQFYGPMLAAVVLKKAISMVRRTARV